MYVDAPLITAPEDETFPYESADDEEPKWCGADLVGAKIKIAYPDADSDSSTFFDATVTCFNTRSKKHKVVGKDFESTEDLNDCHWRYKFMYIISVCEEPLHNKQQQQHFF